MFFISLDDEPVYVLLYVDDICFFLISCCLSVDMF